MRNTTVSIAMPRPMKEFVKTRLKGGSFGNVSEYFRHLVREDQKRAAQDRLEQLLLEGERSGKAVKVDDAWWTERREALERRIKKAGRRKSA